MFLVRCRPRVPRLAAVPAATFVLGIALGAGVASGIGNPPGTIVIDKAVASPPTRSALPPTFYPANVLRVIDGDTFDARVRVWPGMEITTRVRLRDIDAPELNGRCDDERRLAREASDALTAMLAEEGVSIGRVAFDKYGGRVLADAATRRTGDVAAALLDAGLVRRYTGRRASWC
jgi:endonuclease YncB( thermonuclease family)